MSFMMRLSLVFILVRFKLEIRGETFADGWAFRSRMAQDSLGLSDGASHTRTVKETPTDDESVAIFESQTSWILLFLQLVDRPVGD
jgi:hypothetical protein